jgi:CDP-glycerol glycerophosphotransferase (TagB/SpsB family)
MKVNINVKSDKGKIKYYDIESISEFLSKIKGSIRPGPKCNSLEQLKIEIIKSLEDDKYYKEQRKTIRDIVHRYKDANSSERVWTLIDNLMSKTID